jgi:hypothetical protein
LGLQKLRDVTFEQAMEDVLGSEFMYEQVGPTIRVYSQAEYDTMRLDVRHLVHKVFTLYYIFAEEAQRMIEPILSAGGVIQSNSPAERERALRMPCSRSAESSSQCNCTNGHARTMSKEALTTP